MSTEVFQVSAPAWPGYPDRSKIPKDWGSIETTLSAPQAMPRYKSYTTVRALKIKEVKREKEPRTLIFEGGHPSISVNWVWDFKYKPGAGDYYVVSDDGFATCKSAKEFEARFTKVEETL